MDLALNNLLFKVTPFFKEIDHTSNVQEPAGCALKKVAPVAMPSYYVGQ